MRMIRDKGGFDSPALFICGAAGLTGIVFLAVSGPFLTDVWDRTSVNLLLYSLLLFLGMAAVTAAGRWYSVPGSWFQKGLANLGIAARFPRHHAGRKTGSAGPEQEAAEKFLQKVLTGKRILEVSPGTLCEELEKNLGAENICCVMVVKRGEEAAVPYLLSMRAPGMPEEQLRGGGKEESFIGQEAGQICDGNRKRQLRYVEETKQFVRENYADMNLSLSGISQGISISAAYLSSLFHELTGQPFTSYLNEVRLDQAKQMLRMTKLPIKEVGFRCGFSSVQNFNRVFKKRMGQTPKQYRDQGAA